MLVILEIPVMLVRIKEKRVSVMVGIGGLQKVYESGSEL